MELLVAMVIFAIMSAIAYSGLQAILNTRAQTDITAAKLKDLQTTMLFLKQDIEQTIERDVRDGYGTSQHALIGGTSGLYQLELTRAGNSNPLGIPRSNLKRIAYSLVNNEFFRLSWKHLDRAQETAPAKFKLLDNVSSFEVRYLDQKQEWQSSWPPTSNMDQSSPGLPVAIEITLTLEQWGEIKRLFLVAGKHETNKQNN